MLKIIIFLFSVCFINSINGANNVLCYYASWGADRPSNGQVFSDDIPADLCTHIFYAFLGLDTDGSIIIMDGDLDIKQENILKLSELKKINPNLKTLFSIGGAAADTSIFEGIASDPEKRQNLLKSAIELCKQYNYDGIDIDWEYPQNKVTYIELLKDLKTGLEPHGLLLAAAVDQLPINVLGYDVPNMAKYLDILNIMTYDFHSPYWQTAQNSPLYFSSLEAEWQRDNLNANSSVTHWIEAGAIPEKTVIGSAFYGKAMLLSDPAKHGLFDPVRTANQPGPYTNNIGTLGYNEICEFVISNATVVWDDEQKVPYLYRDELWIGYENEESVKLKAEYALKHNLFGIMMWSLETDDVAGFCGTKWGLLKAINSVMKN